MLWGAFYGPGAEEIGATFSASGGDTVLTGAMTGQRTAVGSTSDGIHNLTLTDIVADERLFGDVIYGLWKQTDGQTDFWGLVDGRTTGSVDVSPGGQTGIGVIDGYMTNPADIDPNGPANFTTYRATVSGQRATISMYKIGGANQELPLTYTSFVNWSTSVPEVGPSGEAVTTYYDRYMVYGIPTPRELLAGLSGSASYAGVVYGGGVATNGSHYAVNGTSQFDIDFSASSYGGWLKLAGAQAGGSTRDFGQWTFAGALGFGEMASTQLVKAGDGTPSGQIDPRFYGTNGQEIGATFDLGTGGLPDENIAIVGVTVAKRK
jgi:hypothetical protein